MPSKLIRHGSDAGYKAELETGNTCERCRAAHREYNRQFTKAGKAKGLKYSRDQVIAPTGAPGQFRGGSGAVRGSAPATPPSDPLDRAESAPTGQGDRGAASAPGPTLGDRMGSLLGRMVNSDNSTDTGYVGESGIPDYLQGESVDPDPEPTDGEWGTVSEEEFVINAAGMAKIEENLGTYISVIGITMEMVDPYCGAVLANNIPKMVERWSKVIAHYPKAANLFLDSKGGIIMQWIGAIQASWPFLYALYEHHLARTVRINNGVLERKMNGNPFRGPMDATTPPMPDDFAYTVS
jgi:hypothetical protein